MKRVTRDVPLAHLAPLLAEPPRATLAFLVDGEVDLLPVRARCDAASGAFAFAPFATCALATCALDGCEVVLVLDDGPYWWQLRGASLRGIARRETGGDAGDWYRIEPGRLLAWDYGQLRDRHGA